MILILKSSEITQVTMLINASHLGVGRCALPRALMHAMRLSSEYTLQQRFSTYGTRVIGDTLTK